MNHQKQGQGQSVTHRGTLNPDAEQKRSKDFTMSEYAQYDLTQVSSPESQGKESS